MCRGRYRLDEAPRPAAHGASSRPVTPDPTKACLDVSSIGRVTLSDGECRWSFPDRASRSGTGNQPPGRPVAAQTAHPAAPAGAGGREIAGTLTVLRPGRVGSPRHLAAARAGGGLEQLYAAARARQSRRDADLAVRDGAVELAGELDDDHVLARLACAAWPGRAARRAGHRYPTGRRCARQAISASGKAVAEDRQSACWPPSFAPHLLPGRTVSALLPMAGTRSIGLSCGDFRAGSQDPGACAAYVARGQRPFFCDRNMPLNCGNVKLRESGP
jgi:hypothetical protein